MSNGFGFFNRGNAGNLILDEANPTLVHRYAGQLVVNVAGGSIAEFNSEYNGYAHCQVTYPSPITAEDPPMVFGEPDYSFTGGAIGLFTHQGAPGRWTGFRVTFLRQWNYPRMYGWGGSARGPAHNQPTGWKYHVCTFRAPPSGDRFGMRLFSATGETIFDSGWPIVPFRGLLQAWEQQGGGYYRPSGYWGRAFSNSTAIDDADRYGVYRHAWPSGRVGVLISALCRMVVLADTGDRNTQIPTIPMIGFPDMSRGYLQATLAYGTIQHAGTAGPALNSFGLLIADLSRAPL